MGTEKQSRYQILNQHKFSTIVADEKKSNFNKYKSIVIGEQSIFELVKYELIIFFFGSLSGAFGIFSRRLFYHLLFRNCGKKVIIGSHIALRHTKNISIGTKAVIDDFAMISARGSEAANISIGNEVLIGRGAHLRVREGVINIGDFSRIGPFSFLGTTQKISIGKYFTSGPLCIIGLLDKNDEDPSIPNAFRGTQDKGGVIIGDSVSFGANVMVLDGVKIGKNSVIGAGAVVTKDIPEDSIAYGVPAQVAGQRS